MTGLGLIVIGALSLFIVGYVLIKTSINNILSEENIEDIADTLIKYLTNTEEGQKQLVMIGGLVGNGVKMGMGINRGKGKMGLMDLGVQLLSGIIDGKQGGIASSLTNMVKTDGEERAKVS